MDHSPIVACSVFLHVILICNEDGDEDAKKSGEEETKEGEETQQTAEVAAAQAQDAQTATKDIQAQPDTSGDCIKQV